MIRSKLNGFFWSSAVICSFLVLFATIGLPQTQNQSSDPKNSTPENVRRRADARGIDPSLQEVGRRAATSAGWPGSRRRVRMSSEDRKRIAALLKPNSEDIEKHKQFLAQDDTGIFRLYPDFDCERRGVVSVAGDCANQVVGGSAHSFRRGSRVSDIRYVNGRLFGIGIFSHEILVDLGDVPIEDLKLDSPGVKHLASFVPANDFDTANQQFKGILSGVAYGGMYFSRSVIPKLNRTYAIRVIAFDNKNALEKRRFFWSKVLEPYLPIFRVLQVDKRIDIIVVVRVIRLEEDGNITLIWKQLRREKSPVITFDKNERLRVFG